MSKNIDIWILLIFLFYFMIFLLYDFNTYFSVFMCIKCLLQYILSQNYDKKLKKL
jgi:hypothetical protein